MQTTRERVDDFLRRWGLPAGPLVATYGDNLYKAGESTALSALLFLLGVAMLFYAAPYWKREVLTGRWWHDRTKAVIFLKAMVPSTLIAIYLNRRPDLWQEPPGGGMTSGDYSMLTWLLLWTWLGLAWGTQERDPEPFSLGDLTGRIKRATRDRTWSNFAGLAAAVLAIRGQFFEAYKAPVISIFLTLAVLAIVLLHKTYARVRKLCTQVHTDVQALLRDLDELTKAKGDDIAKKTDAALRSWDALNLNLRAGIDTGYSVGMPFLPNSTLQTLERKILATIRLGPATPHAISEVGKELRALQAACTDRLDPLA
ncbi:hypothetical protein [Streptomyces nojiriensis]|uniref:hypothetical protein n=1 Tax=Streptomyces nojiriensis TaxID=66374 RepID=UPI00365702A0